MQSVIVIAVVHHGPLSHPVVNSGGLSVSHLLALQDHFKRVGRFHVVVGTVVEWVLHSQVACGDMSIMARLLSKTNQTPYIARVEVKAETLKAQPEVSGGFRGTSSLWTED